MQPVKDILGLGVPSVYEIPCSCGLTYIGQTGRSTEIRCREHQHYLRLGQEEKSALVKHAWETGSRIYFNETKTAVSVTRLESKTGKGDFGDTSGRWCGEP